MSVTFHNMTQGTSEWHQVRCGLFTASEVGSLLTDTGKIADNNKSRDLLYTKAAQRLTGNVDVQKPTFAMERGHDDEAEARDLYSAKIAPVHEVGFITRVIDGMTLGYSPDGVVGEDGLIECKSRCQKFQMETLIRQDVPREFMAQLQAGLLISGRKWIDFISFPACGGGKMMVLRVFPDEDYAARIVEALQEAEAKISALMERYYEALTNQKARYFETERRDYDDSDEVELLDA